MRGFKSVKDTRIGQDIVAKNVNYDYIEGHYNKAENLDNVKRARANFERPAYYGTIAEVGK